MNENAKIRQFILEALYKAREAEVIGENKWICEDDFAIEPNKRYFALQVLDELELVSSVILNHKLHYVITGAGVLACEQGQGVC